MAITIDTAVGPVILKEAFDGYRAGIGTDGPYVVKQYLCPSWEVTFPVVNALKGFGLPPIPHACPESKNLRCVDAAVEPRAEVDARDGGRPRFNLPVVTATYGVLTWNALPQDDPANQQGFDDNGQPFLFMEQSISFDTEVIKLPNTAYHFPSDGTVIDTPVAHSVAVAEFVLTRKWQAAFPVVNVTNYLNTLNQSTFLGQAKGQIKFRKAQTRRSWTSDGTATQDVTYTFQWREFDHNKQHRPDASLFELIVDKNGVNPYRYTDLTQLFPPVITP